MSESSWRASVGGRVGDNAVVQQGENLSNITNNIKVNLSDPEASRLVQLALTMGIELPPPFVGRFVDREDELRAIAEAFNDEPVRVGVCGRSGIGKTTCVQHFFKLHHDRLYEPAWLRADNLISHDSRAPTPPGAPTRERDVLLAVLLASLKAHLKAKPRVVLVFDNVQAAPEEVQWLSTRLGEVPMLFLSWDAEALPPCNRLIQLGTLPAAASQDLIACACRPEQRQDETSIRQLCHLLGNDPLLLDLAGRRLLRTPGLMVRELLEQLQSPEARLKLQGRTIDRQVVLREVLRGSYECLDLVERNVLAALAAAGSWGVSEQTLRWLVRRFGLTTNNNLDRAQDLGLLEALASPDWRGNRYRLRLLVTDFLQTTAQFELGRATFDEYLSSPEALQDSSTDVAVLALDRQLRASAPALPHRGEWVESLVVNASPEMRARVRTVLAQVRNHDQVVELGTRLESILRMPRSEQITIELLQLLGLWRIPTSQRILTQLWLNPHYDTPGQDEYMLSRDIRAAAGKALAELEQRTYGDFLLAGIEGTNPNKRTAALDVAAHEQISATRSAILRLLNDPNARWRALAADALGEYVADPLLVERLWDLVQRDPDEKVRARAAASLGVWKDDRVLPYFLSQLNNADPYVRAEVCSILWQFRRPDVADRVFEIALRDPEIAPRINATFVLADGGDPRAGELSLRLIESDDAYSRMVGAFCFQRLIDESVVSDDVRSRAGSVVATWLHLDQIELRLLARAVLVALHDRRAEPGFWSDLTSDESRSRGSTYRGYLVLQLASWWPPGFDPAQLRPMLRDPDPTVREHAILVAGQLRAPKLIPDLESLLEDRSAQQFGGKTIGDAASEALDRIAGKREPWQPVPAARRGLLMGG